ncbi:PstS family phosphate ABC transporter substrate-binding protein [Pseudohaliea rubra]|uniref:Phosphate-binding protein n=1 Tax=Pseudohaliea rubra DSM 19751 TaxID=1265313 RepID=A0A095VQM9_9GAMM|nr:phosphate ABC transporter substrate-binding protein [Pseudohaliea rubra]KGE03423.1 Phosphate ABC transporter, periplasmic phosphate-binding protein PstS [Pseudohaliea rubra DSM 19751]
MGRGRPLRLASLLLALLAVPALADRTLPSYEPAPGLVGSLSSAGSDTLANLMSLWARAFSAYHPAVKVEVQAAGSATAPPALVEGTAELGPMSRAMSAREVAAFEARFGYPPTALPVAVDAVAVFVHQDNPLRAISLEELDAIYSSTRRCGASRSLSHWGDLGLGGSWRRRPLVAYGRNTASGTHSYFRSEVLCDGDFHPLVNELPGSASVVQAVGASLGAIGYSSLGYESAGVRPLAVSDGEGPALVPTAVSAASGRYPLARYLYSYVNRPPGRPLAPLEREFFRFVYSREGQRLVLQDGYVPLPAGLIDEQRQALGL